MSNRTVLNVLNSQSTYDIKGPVLYYVSTQELLNFHLDSRANWKISKRRFFGDFLNSFNWVTQIGPKTTQKIFFENISKTTGATVIQNSGILDGAADLGV